MPPGTKSPSTSPRESIRDLRSRYSWYVDNGEWKKWSQLFTEDAQVDYAGIPRLKGRDEIYTFARETIAELYTYSAHTAQMPRLTVDGTHGTGEWYLVLFYEKPNGSEGWVTGTYTDEYRRVDGEWKFSEVINEVDHDSGEGSPHLQ